MSGGVDSSVAAYLLKEQGYDVIGLTFRNWPQDCISRAEDKCCGPQAVTDARMVAHAVGVPHYVVDEIENFQKHVIDYFVAEYKAGRTPNPCVICNEKVKFGSLLEKAAQLGADSIATGHYARIIETPHGRELRKGLDDSKDQSYFLFSLRQDQLARAMMPLGSLSKEETRAIATKLGLKTHDKVESQEICFVPDKDYGKYLREGAKLADNKGEIVSRDGKVLGHHDGIQYFTIGQREGLRLGGQKVPLYVVALEAETNRVIVGPAEDLMRERFDVANCNWLAGGEPSAPVEVTVKIRYNHRGCPATVENHGNGRVLVRLHQAQRAITPGQAAVFYQDDLVLGGGWICG
jgi:tRNA-specific 2-thiouridylase